MRGQSGIYGEVCLGGFSFVKLGGDKPLGGINGTPGANVSLGSVRRCPPAGDVFDVVCSLSCLEAVEDQRHESAMKRKCVDQCS